MTHDSAPTVHLNGTSADELMRQAIEASAALRAAYKACSNAAPNARDYYVKPGSMALAQAEHVAIMQALDNAIEHYYAIAEHVTETRRR